MGQLPCMNQSHRKASRVINQIYDRELAEVGLKCGQFSILRATRELRQTTNAELQDLLVLEQTTLTKGLKALIRDGYIKSEPGEDRREKLSSTTSAGNTLRQGEFKMATDTGCCINKPNKIRPCCMTASRSNPAVVLKAKLIYTLRLLIRGIDVYYFAIFQTD